MHRMTSNDLEHLTVKNILYTLRTNPRSPNFFARLALQSAMFEMQGCWKSEMHRMTFELMNLNT